MTEEGEGEARAAKQGEFGGSYAAWLGLKWNRGGFPRDTKPRITYSVINISI